MFCFFFDLVCLNMRLPTQAGCSEKKTAPLKSKWTQAHNKFHLSFFAFLSFLAFFGFRVVPSCLVDCSRSFLLFLGTEPVEGSESFFSKNCFDFLIPIPHFNHHQFELGKALRLKPNLLLCGSRTTGPQGLCGQRTIYEVQSMKYSRGSWKSIATGPKAQGFLSSWHHGPHSTT